MPPHFSSDVLGHKNPELDRGVTIRHTEGIYSKRLKTAGVNMPRPEHRGERSPDGSHGPSLITFHLAETSNVEL